MVGVTSGPNGTSVQGRYVPPDESLLIATGAPLIWVVVGLSIVDDSSDVSLVAVSMLCSGSWSSKVVASWWTTPRYGLPDRWWW